MTPCNLVDRGRNDWVQVSERSDGTKNCHPKELNAGGEGVENDACIKSEGDGTTVMDRQGKCTRSVRKVSSHFEYLENRSRDLDVTWQSVRGDLTVRP